MVEKKDPTQGAMSILEHAALCGFDFQRKGIRDGLRWEGVLADAGITVVLYGAGAEREAELESEAAAAIAEGKQKLVDNVAMGAAMADSYFEEMMGKKVDRTEPAPIPPADRESQLKCIGSSLIMAGFNGMGLDDVWFLLDVIPEPTLKMPACCARCTSGEVDIRLAFHSPGPDREKAKANVRRSFELGQAMRAMVDSGAHVTLGMAAGSGFIHDDAEEG